MKYEPLMYANHGDRSRWLMVNCFSWKLSFWKCDELFRCFEAFSFSLGMGMFERSTARFSGDMWRPERSKNSCRVSARNCRTRYQEIRSTECSWRKVDTLALAGTENEKLLWLYQTRSQSNLHWAYSTVFSAARSRSSQRWHFHWPA